MVNRKKSPRHFLLEPEKKLVEEAIRKAEGKTSGEIRIVLDHQAGGDVLAQARKAFNHLKMVKTKHRNAVLIFLAVKDGAFAILGDKGIHEKLGQGFWNETAAQMQKAFAGDAFGTGLETAIQRIGESLAIHFPREKKDANELPDRIREV